MGTRVKKNRKAENAAAREAFKLQGEAKTKARAALKVGGKLAKVGGVAGTALALAASTNKEKSEAHNKRMVEERIKQAKGQAEAPRKGAVLNTQKPQPPKAEAPKADKPKGESFGAAFKRNRKAGASAFKWQGKTYSTKTKEEQGPTKNSEFGEAFKVAKAAGKSAFSFKGKRYTTKSK